jgi:hypothetical protein
MGEDREPGVGRDSCHPSCPPTVSYLLVLMQARVSDTSQWAGGDCNRDDITYNTFWIPRSTKQDTRSSQESGKIPVHRHDTNYIGRYMFICTLHRYGFIKHISNDVTRSKVRCLAAEPKRFCSDDNDTWP